MSNVTGFKKIQNHPDRDEIVEKLIAGDSVRAIEAWLKQKYPTNKKKWISYISLQSYRKNYLNIEAEALKDLQKKRREQQLVKREQQRQEAVSFMPAYQQGMANYVQDSLIDYNAEILNLLQEAREGMDHLKELNLDKGSHLNHQAIAAYMEKYKSVIEMHAKLVADQEKKAGDQIAEDYEQLNKKMEVLVEAVKEVFTETYPEGLSIFVAKVKEKMSEAGLTE